jgi:NADH-quinone oxidoreductase subunit M
MVLLLLLLLPAFSAIIVSFLRGNAAKGVAFFLSFIPLIGTLGLLLDFNQLEVYPTYFAEWIPQLGINFALKADGLSMLMLLLTSILTPIIILYGFADEKSESPHLMNSMILFMQATLIGVFTADDVFLYYLFWEAALVPIVVIMLRFGDQLLRYYATLKFLVYTVAGSLVMLFAILYIYFLMPEGERTFFYANFVDVALTAKEQGWIFWAFFIAFAIKMPVFPFHSWQPDAYVQAPAQGSMLLSGIMLKMGLYSMFRFLLPIAPIGTKVWVPYVMVLAIIGIVYGAVVAIEQRNIKRLIAFSSFSHVGLMAAGALSFSYLGYQGTMFQMFSHGINVVGLFIVADILGRRHKIFVIDQMGGVRSKAPWLATTFLIILLGSVALPLTNGFVGEFLLLRGLFDYNIIITVFAGLTVIFSAVYMLRAYQDTMLGEPHRPNQVFADLNLPEKVTLVLLAALVIIFGVYPQPILDLTAQSTKEIIELMAKKNVEIINMITY